MGMAVCWFAYIRGGLFFHDMNSDTCYAVTMLDSGLDGMPLGWESHLIHVGGVLGCGLSLWYA